MRVLFLGLGVPNLNKHSTMYTNLLIEFHRHGHEILIVGPAYNSQIVGLQKESKLKIPVLRVLTWNLFGVGKFEKGLANIMLPIQYKRALKKCGVNLKFDLVIMPTPPITLIDLAGWFKKKYNSKIYLILRDIFPQNAVDLKMMTEGGFIHKYFRKKEKKMYALSDIIGCMSQGNIDFVKKHNPEVAPKKLHLMPNWDDLLPLETEEANRAFKKKMGYSNKFLVVFGGNVGKPQKMENIVKLAKACEEITDIHFLIVGDGYEIDNFEDMIKKEKLQNVEIKDYMPRKIFFKLMQSADVGLISLSEDFSIPNIPSKALAYYNAKKPILASLDKNTDFSEILDSTNSGIWARAGNTKELKSKLLYLYNNPEEGKKMGKNGYEYMKAHLTVKEAFKRATNELEKIGLPMSASIKPFVQNNL